MVKRTEYWDPNNPDSVVRDGQTTYAESLADVERYFLPMERLRTAALHGWGVAAGLRVTAAPGASVVTVSPGTAVDSVGNQIVLVEGGAAVVDQSVGPDQLQNVPTVMVGANGVTVDTAGLSGEVLLTITWREVLGENDWVTAPALVHAPWLRLVTSGGFSDVGKQVVLARLTLGADGKVAAGGLTAGRRRTVGVPAGRLELRVPRAGGGGQDPLVVDQGPTAELAPDPNGAIVLTLLGGTQPRTALTIDQATGDTRLSAGLSVAGDAKVGGTLAAADLAVAKISGTSLSVSGPVAAGDVTAAKISGASLSVSGPVAAGDVTAAKISGASLSVSGPVAAGNVTAASLGVSGQLRGGSVVVAGGVTSGGIVEAFQYRTDGQSWLRGQVYTGEVFGHWDGKATLKLFGSNIWDGGDNWLQIQSGGGNTFMRGNVTVEGQSSLRGQVFTGEVFGHWGSKATLWLFGSSIWDSGDNWLQIKSGGGQTYLRGQVTVEGVLHKPGGGFKIDHPLAPGDKYLSHSFVESPEMVNLYTGVAVTDEDGEAKVSLPDFFEALNRDHQFQLTTIGQLALATVVGGVQDNAFTIRTDKPRVTVSWQVTGVRQDPWAEANRIPVVEEKSVGERGLFMHPQLYGQPDDRAVLPAAPQSTPAAPQSMPAPQSVPSEPEGTQI